MIKRVCAVLVILASLLISCVSTSDTMGAWVGADESALIDKWGEPNSVIPNEPNGKIFVYIRIDTYLSQGAGDVNRYGSGTIGSDIPGQEMSWKRQYMFWLDKEGVVYDWDKRKEEIPVSVAEENDSRRSH